jgi:hypothetical protein
MEVGEYSNVRPPKALHAEDGMYCQSIHDTRPGSLASNRQEAKSVHGEALQPFIFRKSEMTAYEFLNVFLNRWIRHLPKTLRQGSNKPHRSGNRWDTGRQTASTYAIVARMKLHEKM